MLCTLYSTLKVPSAAVGGVFAILNRRRGVPIGSERNPGTPMEIVKAYLPVKEAFGEYSSLPNHCLIAY